MFLAGGLFIFLFWAVVKSTHSGYSEISSPLWPLHLSVWPWESHFNTPGFDFLLSKKGINN